MAGATGAMESGSGSGAAATGDGVFDVAHIGEVKTWLRGAFEAVGKEVLEFEYTPSTVAHLHSLATLSQHRTHAANVIAPISGSKLPSTAAKARDSFLLLLHFPFFQFFCWALPTMLIMQMLLGMMAHLQQPGSVRFWSA
jgi:hypothetical protein